MRHLALFVAAVLTPAPATALGAGDWSGPLKVPGPAGLTVPHLGMDARGEAVLAPASWDPAQTLPEQAFGELRLGADASGNAILAWGQAPTAAHMSGSIALARRPAAGVFGAPRRLTPAGDDVRAMGLAVAPAGPAAIAWRVGERRAGARLMLIRGRAGGSFGTPRRITSTGSLPNGGWIGASSHPADPALAVAGNGAVVVAWLAAGAPGCGFVVRATTVTGSGPVGAPRRVSPRCPHATGLRAAVDGAGDGALAWRAGARCNYGTACHYAIQAARIVRGRVRAGGTISRRPVAANGMALAAGGGRAVVVWRDAARAERALTRGRVLAATLRSGRWSAPQAISVADRIAGVPAVAIGPRGQAVVAWKAVTRLNGPATVQVAVARSARGAFSSPDDMTTMSSGVGYAAGPLATVDPAGGALVAWSSDAGDLTTATRTPEGPWEAAGTLTGARAGIAVTAGAPGEVLAAWMSIGANGQIGPLAWSLHR